MNLKKIVASFVAILIVQVTFEVSVYSQQKTADMACGRDFKTALRLYDAGMYGQARNIFASLAEGDAAPWAEGYAILCSEKMQTPGYEQHVSSYIDRYPYSGLLSDIHCQYGLNLFEEGKYEEAAGRFALVKENLLSKKALPEYVFKSAYCRFNAGDKASALAGFDRVVRLPKSDYTAPSQYLTGYINYEDAQFANAVSWFEKSEKDPRFEEMSSYYIVECNYLLKNYDYVTRHGEELYARVSPDRKEHLARIISESFLVKGDTGTAKKYYDSFKETLGNNRADYFYAGSLLYALKDYQGAVRNFTAMTERTDSIGQAANYQLGYSYIKIKNKVAALDAFKSASEYAYDKELQEDAFFNYAKLAFDLNNDTSVFNRYIKTYADKAKGEKIYSYMALAALYNRDYAGAIDAYDKIDELDEDMKLNYMKANYLRANQLIEGGSYRSAVPCLKAASYYAGKYSPFGQMAMYWLAESYYRDELYQEAKTQYNSLYNLSALDGRTEGNNIPYDMAYCHFKDEDYPAAIKWFSNYISEGRGNHLKDAMVRRADCYFITKDYKAAAESYDLAVTSYPDVNDIYPYYQAGLSYGLMNKAATRIERLSAVKNASPSAAFYSEAMYELGRAYASASKNDEAAGCYRAIVDAGKDKDYMARALTALGMMSRNAKQYDEAIGYYKRIVEEMPSSELAVDAMASIESIYRTKQEPQEYAAYVESLGSKASLVTQDDPRMVLYYSAEQIFLDGSYQKAVSAFMAYESKYPDADNISKAHYYIAESYKNLDKKDKACDFYKKAIEGGENAIVEQSALNFAVLSYSMEHYEDALAGYRKLDEVATLQNNRKAALVGMMRSAYMARQYDEAIAYAAKVSADKSGSYDDRKSAAYITGKSYLATSRRDKAMAAFKSIAASVSSAEGAEAAYILIQDSYDRGDFEDVEQRVYKFADSGTTQDYWKARAFIVLGDSFADRGDMAQAKATFESIRDGYTPSGSGDDVPDQVKMRLDKMAGM